jgi:hypothetical protein
MSPQSSGLNHKRNKKLVSAGSKDSRLLHASLLPGLLFNPEDGGDIFLSNLCRLSMDYMALYPRTQNSSKQCLLIGK